MGGRNIICTLLAALLPALALPVRHCWRRPPRCTDGSDDDELQEVIVTAPEPRYVAPTRRDRIGRIWAPVYINDKGPFRLVLIRRQSFGNIASVAAALELPLHKSETFTCAASPAAP
jgi:hypothetical protein